MQNGYHTYGRILENGCYAFYDGLERKEINDLQDLAKRKILFIIAVYNSAINSGRWIKIGKLPLDDELKNLPLNFIKDALDPEYFKIYNPNTGIIRPAEKMECSGLECAAVWEAEHVEERILDHYAGKPNKWVESLKLK